MDTKGHNEVTPYSVSVGLLMTILFSAAAAYLGLKVGQVFEAAIPIAIIAVGLTGALKNIMNRYSTQIKNEIPYHLDRWAKTIHRDYTARVWKKNIKSMEKWAENRPAYFLSYLKQINKYFK